jgi:integrase
MAYIQKRTAADGATSYRVQIRIKGFPIECATFDRLTDAKTWAAKTETDIRAGRHFGAAKRKTLGDLFDSYEEAAAPHLKSWDGVKRRLDWWREKAGGETLDAITPARIAKWRDELMATPTFRNGGTGKRSNADVNRALAALSAAMKHGINELGWIEANPVKRVTKPKEAGGRIRFLSDEELPRLLAAVRASSHPDLLPAVLLALTTGARSGEILGLRWEQIDFARRTITLRQGETKNDTGRALPLSVEVAELLKERAKVRRIDDDRVFPPNPDCKAVYLDAEWKRVLVASGIDARPSTDKRAKPGELTSDFRWHDLRHTAASYLTMSGVSAIEVARVLGHKTLAMSLRYSHLTPDRVTELGDKLTARMGLS